MKWYHLVYSSLISSGMGYGTDTCSSDIRMPSFFFYCSYHTMLENSRQLQLPAHPLQTSQGSMDRSFVF